MTNPNDRFISAATATTPPLAADEIPFSRGDGVARKITVGNLRGGVANVQDYGAKGDGVTNDYAAILAASAAAVSAGTFDVYFPFGTYLHVTPFVITDSRILWRGQPGTVLKYTGSATAAQFTFDGSASANGLLAGLRDLIFDSNGLCTNGLLLRLATHSLFENIRVTNCTAVAYVIEACTLSTFINLVCSSNVAAFGTQPTTGIKFQAVSAGALTGAVGGATTLIDPIIEGVSAVGIDISGYLGVTIFGGTSEANATGLKATGTGNLITCVGLDMESNSTFDLDIATANASFVNCIASSTAAVKLRSGAFGCHFYGGYINNIVIDSGATNNSGFGVSFVSSGTQIADSGLRNVFLLCNNANTGDQISPVLATGSGKTVDNVITALQALQLFRQA